MPTVSATHASRHLPGMLDAVAHGETLDPEPWRDA